MGEIFRQYAGDEVVMINEKIMDTDRIKIKCPYCSAVLVVRKQSGLERMNISCPVCKETSPFRLYKTVVDKTEKTEYPGAERAEYDETEIGEPRNGAIGSLRLLDKSIPPFKLKVGKNIIGRKASTSEADIQIPVGDSKRMSREHLVIEVKNTPDQGYVHYMSLCKQKQNNTYLNNELVEYGDCIALQSGDRLELPDAVLIFEIK